MCEITLLGEPTDMSVNQQGITGLSTLLLYTVIGFFISKIKGIVENNWNRRSTQFRYSLTYCTRWIMKILLEWAKAVAVVLCIRDKGIDYQPDPIYTTITLTYYICTEKILSSIIVKSFSYLNFSCFDSMEHLYIPIVLNSCSLLCAAGITLLMTLEPQALYAAFASYFVIYLRAKDLYYNYVKTLLIENETFASFRPATNNDIEEWDDICAVCLNSMSRARITSCNHLFHPTCLKQCLRRSLYCPLCKHNFIE